MTCPGGAKLAGHLRDNPAPAGRPLLPHLPRREHAERQMQDAANQEQAVPCTTCTGGVESRAPRPTNWPSWRTSGIGASSLLRSSSSRRLLCWRRSRSGGRIGRRRRIDGRRQDHARRRLARRRRSWPSRRQAFRATGGVGVRRQRTTRASPWPPPPHRAATPSPPPRRRNSWSRVRASRLPEAPIGWPRAMAPPLGLTTSSGSGVHRSMPAPQPRTPR